MTKHRTLDAAQTLLAAARAALPEARAELDALIDIVRRGRHDRSKIVEVGRALEAIAKDKLYRLHGHPNLEALLDDLGVSRTSAHKWRAIARSAREGDIARDGIEAAYERARRAARSGVRDDAPARPKPTQATERAARAID
jgi:hypothetical protein